jgi:DNA invertase Pin-like site-specific DNA recombinase
MNKNNFKRSLRANVLRRVGPKSKPAKASQYLNHLDEYHKQYPDMQAIVYCRDSARTQGYKRNLKTYEKVLRWELKQRGIFVVGRCHREICSGWVLNEDRWALMNAVEEAKKLIAKGKKVVIVAPSSDRFLRNKYFTVDKPDLLPTEAEFEKLKKLTCGVPLVTLLDPDMPPKEARGFQSKWGQSAKGNKGGRPRDKIPGYKKQRRKEKIDKVIELHKQGVNPCHIAAFTLIPVSTVNDWIAKYIP